MTRTRGSANVFVAVTLATGTLVAALVPGGYLVYLAIGRGDVDVAALPTLLGFMAYGGGMGFLVAGSVAAGAALVGTLARDSQWVIVRGVRFAAPFVGAVVSLTWLPFVAPNAWAVWAIASIPAVTVGVTPWLRWPGGFMNPRAIAQSASDVHPAGEPHAERHPSERRRGWGEVILVSGSILIMTIAVVALVLVAPGSEGLGAGRPPAAVIIAGVGMIGAVIALLRLRPDMSSQQRDRESERTGDQESSAACGKL